MLYKQVFKLLSARRPVLQAFAKAVVWQGLGLVPRPWSKVRQTTQSCGDPRPKAAGSTHGEIVDTGSESDKIKAKKNPQSEELMVSNTITWILEAFKKVNVEKCLLLINGSKYAYKSR